MHKTMVMFIAAFLFLVISNFVVAEAENSSGRIFFFNPYSAVHNLSDQSIVNYFNKNNLQLDFGEEEPKTQDTRNAEIAIAAVAVLGLTGIVLLAVIDRGKEATAAVPVSPDVKTTIEFSGNNVADDIKILDPNTTALQSVTIKNTGSYTINNLQISGLQGILQANVRQTTDCGASLAPNASCEVNFEIKNVPDVLSGESTSIFVTGDNIDSSELSVVIDGDTAVFPDPVEAEKHLQYRAIKVLNLAANDETITNIGWSPQPANGELEICEPIAGNQCAGRFQTDSRNCVANETLLKNASCLIWLHAKNATALLGPQNETLQVAATDKTHNIIVKYSRDLYAGGEFTNKLVKWNGSNWQLLIGGHIDVNGSVNAIVVDVNGDLIAGGKFDFAGIGAANNIARWNGNSWNDLDGGVKASTDFPFSPAVFALHTGSDGKLYVGGVFSHVDDMISANSIAEYSGGEWSQVAQGVGNTDINIEPRVNSIASYADGVLAVGGFFNQAFPEPSTDIRSIAEWNSGSWDSLYGGVRVNFQPGIVNAMVVDKQGSLFVGGSFLIAGYYANNLAKRIRGSQYDWDIGYVAGVGADDVVNALAIDNSSYLVVGGRISEVDTRRSNGLFEKDQDANNVARWDGTAWDILNNGLDNIVRSLTVDTTNNHIFAGGEFTHSFVGDTMHYIAEYLNNNWQGVGEGLANHPNGFVKTIQIIPSITGFSNGGGYWLANFSR